MSKRKKKRCTTGMGCIYNGGFNTRKTGEKNEVFCLKYNCCTRVPKKNCPFFEEMTSSPLEKAA